MRLNLNAKELLSLYDALHASASSNDDVQLRQVYNRIRSILIASLSSKTDAFDPTEEFFNREQAKIDRLTKELDDVKKDAGSLVKKFADAGKQGHNLGILIPDDVDDFEVVEYPKKASRQQQRVGKHQGNKR